MADLYAANETLVDHRSPKGPVISAFRGTLLASAIDRLKECGYFEQYSERLSPQQRDELLFCLPMSWVPISLMTVHVETCDQLGLTDSQLIELGGETANSMVRNVLSTIGRATGASPWTAIAMIDRLWDRLHEGGACVVIRTGPKDVIIEHHGNPLANSRYYRTTAQGFYRSLAEMFSSKAYVKLVRPRQPSLLSFAVAASWV